MWKYKNRKHICPDCLSDYKRTREGRKAKKEKKYNIHAKWGKSYWPVYIYCEDKTRKCRRHHLIAIAHSSKRRALKLNAFPLWANTEKIKQIYLERIEKEFRTGKKYHVDHIVPLQGRNVCGFHVEYNLQILPASVNNKKSNKFNPINFNSLSDGKDTVGTGSVFVQPRTHGTPSGLRPCTGLSGAD